MTRKMKDSGIEWIGEIPEDWKLTKVKHIGKYINGYPFKPSDWSDSGVPIIRIQNLTGNNSEYNYYSGPKLPEDYFIIKNDYLISWSATLGVFIWHKDKGYLNQHIFKAVPNEAVINYDYFYWIAKIFIEEIQSYMHGSAMQHVTKAVFDNFTIPLPSGKQEQIKISETLSSKIALKNSTKQSIIKEIQTLEDYKKSIITEAVTQGLDKNVEMKDSGIEWIGEIPKHWKKIELRYLSSIVRGGSPRPISNYMSDNDTDLNWIKIGDTEKGSKYINRTKNKLKISGLSSTTYVKKGELILSNSMSYGEAYILNIDGCIHDGWLAFKEIKNVDQEYLYFSLLSTNTLAQFDMLCDGGVVQNLNIDKVKTVKIFIPNLDEQVKIADYLNKKTKLIDESIAIKQKQLKTLEEYKKSLIYEYVTGKKEVKDGEET